MKLGTGKGADAFEIMTSGEPFRATELAQRVGAHGSVVYIRRREAEALGFIFTQDQDGSWRCLNTSHEPTKANYDRLHVHRRESNPGAYNSSYKRKKKAVEHRALPPTRPFTEEERERERLAAQERVRAREERERLAQDAAAKGHNLSLFEDPGASMMGMPFDAELRTIANGNGNGHGMMATPPQLGQQVQVFAMVLEDDGTLRLGLQTGERRWVAKVIGEMAR